MKNVLKNFHKNSIGTTSTIFATCAVPLLLAVGAATDFMRRNDARDTLVAIVDASVLAGAQALVDNNGNKKKAEKVAEKHFKSAIANEQYPWNLNVNFKARSDGLAMEGKGTATLDTSIMKMVGIDEMTLYPLGATDRAVAEIGGGSQSSNLEVVLMLDLTGSMCDDGDGPCSTGNKLNALKTAATDLVEKVIWDDQSQYTSRVAIVPFSTRVRVGPNGGGGEAMAGLTGLPPTWSGYVKDCIGGFGSGSSSTSENNGNGDWTCPQKVVVPVENIKVIPCVTDRHSYSPERFIFTDAKPSSDDWFNGASGSRSPVSEDSSDEPDTDGTGATADDPFNGANYNETGKCYDVHENNQVLGLTNNKQKLQNKIGNLVAHGSTAGVLGTSVAWAMLAPGYGDLFGADAEPASYDNLTSSGNSAAKKVRKIAVLMTDGAYNTFRGWKGQDIEEVSAAAVQMCDEMKAKGVEIFTVGYELNDIPVGDTAQAKDTLQACGSSIDHFYNSLNPNKLKKDFEDIANQLSGEASIRLVR